MTHSEVVIVGGGIIGSSIAYHLALREVPTVVVSMWRGPLRPPSASWASAGGVRQQGRDSREWVLTVEASRRWPALERELGTAFDFRQGGHLHIVERDEDVPVLEARVARERAAGLDVRLVDAAEVRALAPGITAGARARRLQRERRAGQPAEDDARVRRRGGGARRPLPHRRARGPAGALG